MGFGALSQLFFRVCISSRAPDFCNDQVLFSQYARKFYRTVLTTLGRLSGNRLGSTEAYIGPYLYGGSMQCFSKNHQVNTRAPAGFRFTSLVGALVPG